MTAPTMNSFTRTILASALAVCASQAALGASVIPHASIPGLVDFGVPFTQNGTVVMSEKYDVFRPNRVHVPGIRRAEVDKAVAF